MVVDAVEMGIVIDLKQHQNIFKCEEKDCSIQVSKK